MPTTSCPSAEQMLAFQAGKLRLEELNEIAGHLETCTSCQTALDHTCSLGDALVQVLQEGQGHDAYADESGCHRAVAKVEALANRAATDTHDETADNERAPSVPIKTVGKYELLESIGQGGMGEVFKARHTVLNRTVAVKLLPPHRLKNADAVARFRREIEAAGRLDHAHIVRASDADSADGQHFLVMEWLPGEDLAHHVRKHGPLPAADACALIRQAALGLDCAHQHGLVHRDVKPSNLMLTKVDGQPTIKVLDLGLALLHDNVAPETELTSVGQVMGTYDFIAPEQAVESHTVDARADIYSLGCTFYFLLTGRAPFAGRSEAKKLVAHQLEEPASLSQHCPNVPDDVAAIVSKMMAKAPAQRHGSMREVAEALEQVSKAQPTKSAASTTAVLAPASPLASAPASRRWLIAASCAMALSIVLAALGLIYGGGVYRFVTNQGILVIDVKDPAVVVKIEQNGLVVKDNASKREFTLSAGKGEIEVREKDGVALTTKKFQLTRGGKTTVTVTLEELAKARKPKNLERRVVELLGKSGGKLADLPLGDQPPPKSMFPGKLLIHEAFAAAETTQLALGQAPGGARYAIEGKVYVLSKPDAKPADNLFFRVPGRANNAAFAVRLRSMTKAGVMLGFATQGTETKIRNLAFAAETDGHWYVNQISWAKAGTEWKVEDTRQIVRSTKPAMELLGGRWVTVCGRQVGKDFELWVDGRLLTHGAMEPLPGAQATDVLAPGSFVAEPGPVRLEVAWLAAWEIPGPVTQPVGDLAVKIARHLANARIAAEKDLHEVAIAEYTEALRLDPNNIDALHGRGIRHGLMSQFRLLVVDLERAAQLAPDRSDFFNLSWGYINTGDLEKCAHATTEVIRRNKLFVGAYKNRVLAYESLGQFELALDDATKLTLIEPAGAWNWDHRAKLLETLGRHKEAQESIAHAIKLDPALAKNSLKPIPLPTFQRFSGHNNGMAWGVAFSSKGDLLYSCGTDTLIRCWEIATGRERRRFEGHTAEILALAVSPDDQWLASGSRDRTARLWDAATGKEVRQLQQDRDDECWGLAFSPDSRRIVGDGGDGGKRAAVVWDVMSGNTLAIADDHANALAFHPDGKHFVGGTSAGRLQAYDAMTGKMVRAFVGHSHWVRKVSISPDGKQVASVSSFAPYRSRHPSDETFVVLWDWSTGKKHNVLSGHTDRVLGLAYAPKSRHIATGGWDDNTVRIWDTATAKEIWRAECPAGIADLAFAPNGREVAAACRDGMIRLWRLPAHVFVGEK